VANRAKTPLTRERILAAALALTDREGLGALSMRTLGTALGVEAMSLYKHFASKEAIVEGLVTQALDEIDWSVDASSPWQDRVAIQVCSLREFGLRHSDAFRVLAAGPALGSASLRPLEGLLAALADGGFARAHAVSVMWTIVSYVLGAVTGELAERKRTKKPKRKQSVSGSVESFPNVAAAAELLEGCDFEEELMAGLRRILAGAVAERSKRRRR
jgi:TetR/AcrR family tetracycline transcriptional repressor